MKNKTNLIEKQLLGGLSDLGLCVVALSAARNHGTALESWRCPVEDEDRLGPQEQELANSSKESQQMSVPYHLALLIPHRLHELHHPYARIWNTIHNFTDENRRVVRFES